MIQPGRKVPLFYRGCPAFLGCLESSFGAQEAPDLRTTARMLKNLQSYWEECWVILNNPALGVMPHQERCYSPAFLQNLREAIVEVWKDYGCKGGEADSLSEFYLRYFPAI